MAKGSKNKKQGLSLEIVSVALALCVTAGLITMAVHRKPGQVDELAQKPVQTADTAVYGATADHQCRECRSYGAHPERIPATDGADGLHPGPGPQFQPDRGDTHRRRERQWYTRGCQSPAHRIRKGVPSLPGVDPRRQSLLSGMWQGYVMSSAVVG